MRRGVGGWPLLWLLEELPISRQLVGVEEFFDLFVGAVPDGAYLSRWTAAFSAGGIGRRTAVTAAAAAATTAPTTHSTTSSAATAATAAAASTTHSTMTAAVFPEVLHRHYLIGQDRADPALLRGIELERRRQPLHPLIDHLTWIHSLLILTVRAGCESETPDDCRANCRGEGQASSSAGNLLHVQ
jgi:hypothetical protein